MNILEIKRPDNYTIGKARNHAIVQCTGGYICTWDDDDWSYPDRLLHQFNNLKKDGKFYEASYLTRIFLYDSTTRIVYFSLPYFWSGSLVCKKELILKHPYLDIDTGEDSHLLGYLSYKNLICQVADSNYLYAYIYHGLNIINRSHFQYLLKKSFQMNDDASMKLSKHFEQQYLII